MVSGDGPARWTRGSRGNVPHIDGLPSSGMIADDGQAPAVGIEGQTHERLADLEIEPRHVPARGHFEEIDSESRGPSVERGEVTAIGRESQELPARMGSRRDVARPVQLHVRCEVPEQELALQVPGGERPAVARDGQAHDRRSCPQSCEKSRWACRQR